MLTGPTAAQLLIMLVKCWLSSDFLSFCSFSHFSSKFPLSISCPIYSLKLGGETAWLWLNFILTDTLFEGTFRKDFGQGNF